MKERKRHILFLTMFTVFLITVLVLPPPLSGGPLDPPDNAVDESGNPVPTMRTLSEIYHLLNFIGCLDPHKMRFVINGDGTVTDCDTGLIWDQNANRFGGNWYEASGTYQSTHNPESTDLCGSLDLGGATDWRLPEKSELQSLVDCSYGNDPCVVNTLGDGQWQEGDPFFQVRTDSSPPESYYPPYWTATNYTGGDPLCSGSNCMILVGFTIGDVGYMMKQGSATVWCVRGP